MIQLSGIFQNGMILQRQKPIKIWGNTDCTQNISVTLNGDVILENARIEGDFFLTLPAQEAMTDAVLAITGTNDAVRLTGVDIGEVWIAGGQSNMEFLLRYDADGDIEIAGADDEHLRFYDVGEYSFPQEETRSKKDSTGWNKWLRFKPEYAEHFSAVGVYFAKQLREHLQVPVAIIGCNWGGTTASSWMDESYLASDPDLREYLEDYAKAIETIDMEEYIAQHDAYLAMEGNPKVSAAMSKALKGTVTTWDLIRAFPLLFKIGRTPIPMGPRNQNSPGCLYRAMVKQIAPISARGVIWYQGESDDMKAQMYDKLFSAMIRCWRDTWQEELPFLFVQLAPFGKWMGCTGEKYPVLRQKQEIVSKTVPGCYMVSIMDSGMKKDIHPKNKRPVGERLALLARGRIYGEDILCEPPELRSAKVKDGCILLAFENTGKGLKLKGNRLNAAKIVVDGKPLKHSKVSVKDNKLLIRNEKIKEDSEAEVYFAWTAYCEVNLYNSSDLPVKPFYWKK